MYVNNYKIPRPPQTSLDQCYRVVMTNPAFKMGLARRWCYNQDLSLAYAELVNGETASENSERAHFYFVNEADALMFTLKWC